MPNNGTIISCNYSRAVIEALGLAQHCGLQFKAIVLPSAGYGLWMIKDLTEVGINVQLANALPRDATQMNTTGLIGAKFVNKNGSTISGSPGLGLAQWCFDRAINCFVLCDYPEHLRAELAQKVIPTTGEDLIPSRMLTDIIHIDTATL